MKPAIEVQDISKAYIINHKNKASYSTLKDDFGNLIRKPFGKTKESSEEEFWALKDVSFEVPQGEIFGVVGQNGSGKSTLLKILSRIVEPTEGSVTMRGRVASLLEVGTGFHPELTGRENIFFNGSMLGMSRYEISQKFNEIVEFSEVEKFIDTPVKFYSSGMYVRLAFSVAAHLEPEILILDEVLAVGDAAFQKKSLKKILSTMQEGRTVLFVSHSMGAVQQLCTRGIFLDKGHVMGEGPIGLISDMYTEANSKEKQQDSHGFEWENDGSVTNEYFIPKKIYLTDEKGKQITSATPNDIDKWVNLEIDVLQENDLYTIGYMIKNEFGNMLYLSLASDVPDNKRKKLHKGQNKLIGKIPKHLLNEGDYKISIVGGVFNKFWVFDPQESLPSIHTVIKGGLSKSPFWTNARSGYIAPDIDWRVEN